MNKILREAISNRYNPTIDFSTYLWYKPDLLRALSRPCGLFRLLPSSNRRHPFVGPGRLFEQVFD